MVDLAKIKYGYCHCGCGEKTTIPKKNRKERKWIKGEPKKFINYHHMRIQAPYGGNHPRWKGDKVSYVGVHSWIHRKYYYPKKCEDCGIKTLPRKQYHWANISGKYKRDIKDFKRLCFKCHRKFDAHLMPRGENHSKAKLTEKEVIEIRRLYVTREYSNTRLAEKFNVSNGAISAIIKRKTWAHLS